MKQQNYQYSRISGNNEEDGDGCIIKIPACYYQPWELPKNQLFLPIQAGKAISKFDLKIQGDDTGDNISAKNATFSEFTAWYWVWKNIKTLYPNLEYIGLSHYRRFFNLEKPYNEHAIYPISNIPDMAGYDRLFIEKLSSVDIVLSKPAYFSCSVRTQYSYCCNETDYLCLKNAIHDMCSEYDNSFKSVFENNNGISLYCIFVSRYKLFNDYFSWLFPLLFEMEKRIDISNNTKYQKRAIAFLAERLLNVYVLHHNLKTDYEPIYFIKPVNFKGGIKKIRHLISLYPGKRLTMWGSGIRGKSIAESMSKMGVSFEITDVNAKIHGKRITANAVVKPWSEVKEHTDVVLVTAERIFEDVRDRLAEESPDIEVVDLIALLDK